MIIFCVDHVNPSATPIVGGLHDELMRGVTARAFSYAPASQADLRTSLQRFCPEDLPIACDDALLLGKSHWAP